MHRDRHTSGDEEAEPIPKPKTLKQCHQVIEVMAVRIEELEQQQALLQEQLKLNSRNSSKPPSSDGPSSGKGAQRRASGRARGAQPGHKGSYRALLEQAQVDQIIDCHAAHMVAFVNQTLRRWVMTDRSGDATRALQATMNQTHIRGLVTSISSIRRGPASL